jgi:hypothetical protein
MVRVQSANRPQKSLKAARPLPLDPPGPRKSPQHGTQPQEMPKATPTQSVNLPPTTPPRKVSKRGRVGEGRPSIYTPELAERLADHIATGLTDEEAAALEGISLSCLQVWRRENPKFLSAIKSAEAQRLKLRLARIEAGDQGWQGTAWALERLYPTRFARPEIQQQIAVVNGANAERVMVIDSTAFDSLVGRPGYRLRNNSELEFKEGGTSYLIVRQTNNANLLEG